jgi:hypothetical protein
MSFTTQTKSAQSQSAEYKSALYNTQEDFEKKLENVRLLFGPPPYLSSHMDRQACTGDIVLVKSREMTGREPNTAVVAEGRRGKDDRKHKYCTLAPLHRPLHVAAASKEGRHFYSN